MKPSKEPDSSGQESRGTPVEEGTPGACGSSAKGFFQLLFLALLTGFFFTAVLPTYLFWDSGRGPELEVVGPVLPTPSILNGN